MTARLAALGIALGLAACATLPVSRPVGRDRPALMTGAERSLIGSGEAAAPMAVVLTGRPGAEVLRTRAVEIDPADPVLPLLLSRMRATMEAEQGIGIAAPQVGISRRVILVTRLDLEPEKRVEACLNPEILAFAGEPVEDWEGCLSVPDGFGRVTRPTGVVVRCLDAAGQPFEVDAHGRTATIFQHEIDHLDGVLFTDRMPAPVRLVPKEEYREMRRREKEARQVEGGG